MGTSSASVNVLFSSGTLWTVIPPKNDCSNCLGDKYDTSTSSAYSQTSDTSYYLYNDYGISVEGKRA